MVAATIEVHQELINLSEGKYSDEQRARMANLAFRRFIDTIRILLDLRAAF